MRYAVIVAARTGSSRLPGKVLKPLGGLPLVVYLLRRLAPSMRAEEIMLATSDCAGDDALAQVVAAEGVAVFRGPEDDVVGRFVGAAERLGCEYVVRVTGDCPFVSAETLDHCLDQCEALPPFDLATTKGRFPVGIDYEVYSAATMARLHTGGELSAEDREHLTLHIVRNRDAFRVHPLTPSAEWVSPGLELTVDTPTDYVRARRLAESFPEPQFPTARLLAAARELDREAP